jgi:Holliday junction resolvase
MGNIYKKRSRKESGLLAQRNGQQFENDVIVACARTGWSLVRIPDACRQVSATKIVRIKAPFDFVAAKDVMNMFSMMNTLTIFFDAKQTNTGRFPASKIKKEQLMQLQKFQNKATAEAGYLVHFPKFNRVVFFPVPTLKESQLTRKGLAPSDGIIVGANDNMQFNSLFRGEFDAYCQKIPY